MNALDCKSRDLDYARELIAMLPDSERHELLVELSLSVLQRVLAWQGRTASSQVLTVLTPSSEAAWNQALKLANATRPTRIAGDSVPDGWSSEWDSAWPEGVLELVLGSRRELSFVRDELMPAYGRRARQMVDGLPSFGAEELDAFLEEWRQRFISALRQTAKGE